MKADKTTSIRMDFEDNDILALLSGEHNHYLAHIEKSLDVSLDSFGNSIKISGPVKSTKTAQRVDSSHTHSRRQQRFSSTCRRLCRLVLPVLAHFTRV